jgi:hypothetical protein
LMDEHLGEVRVNPPVRGSLAWAKVLRATLPRIPT